MTYIHAQEFSAATCAREENFLSTNTQKTYHPRSCFQSLFGFFPRFFPFKKTMLEALNSSKLSFRPSSHRHDPEKVLIKIINDQLNGQFAHHHLHPHRRLRELQQKFEINYCAFSPQVRKFSLNLFPTIMDAKLRQHMAGRALTLFSSALSIKL